MVVVVFVIAGDRRALVDEDGDDLLDALVLPCLEVVVERGG